MKKIEWTLRIAMFGEFLGHGVFAYQAAPHFRLLLTGSLGISEETAATVLPVIGTIDFTIAALSNALAGSVRQQFARAAATQQLALYQAALLLLAQPSAN